MIEWPAEFYIKSRRWRVLYVDKEDPALKEGDDSDYNLGICRADQRTIWVCTDQDLESKQDTLVHELIHACYATASMFLQSVEDAEDFEENIVLFATEAFFEIMRNSESDWWR